MKGQWKVIAVLALLILVVVFAIINTQAAEVNFGFGLVYQVPTVLIILICLLLGAILGLVTSMGGARHQRQQNKELRGQIQSLQAEKESIRLSMQAEIDSLKDSLGAKQLQDHNTASVAQDNSLLVDTPSSTELIDDEA